MFRASALVFFVGMLCLLSFGLTGSQGQSSPPTSDPNTARLLSQYTGSQSCRPCHERFYTLWSTSHHGLAMQPYSYEFAQKELTPQTESIACGPYQYRAEHTADGGRVIETGLDGEKQYPILHVMGGKNVYFFLTPMERGRLQVLPVSYDVRTKEWYNTTASMIRHFPDATDQAVDWKDSLLTFNAACYNCHVSQLSTNYDFASDTYRTTWTEPGINCETCHGPGQEHIRICAQAQANKTPLPKDLKAPIISQKHGFTAHQTDTNCSLCHTKGAAFTTTYRPGDNYFNHYDLTTLEDPDFYPDGRDLGENYTYTQWRMSPCVRAGKLDCLHCHTSSGRFRFKDSPNQACAACHQERVTNAAEHTHHPQESNGNLCTSCHMPMTEFARMRRSDHSMRPPMPAATMAFGSPNACTLCHADKDPKWADEQVRKWRTRDYQKPVLHIAGLIAAARKNDWKRLEEMLAYLKDPQRDEIYANSLVRLLVNCPDERKWPVLIALLEKDPSPLIRSSAAVLLADYAGAGGTAALVKAAQDPYRIVRIRAGSGLAGRERLITDPKEQAAAAAAIREYEETLNVRPDHWSSHYNRGNFYMARGEYKKAIGSFQTARRLRPDVIEPLVNLSFAYNRIEQNDLAEQALRQAASLDPNQAAIHLNLALLLGEMDRIEEAEAEFRKAYTLDRTSAAAAYNLGVIAASKGDPDKAAAWVKRAWDLRPDEDRYGYTCAFYMVQLGRREEAIEILEGMVKQQTEYADVYGLLNRLYEQRKNRTP